HMGTIDNSDVWTINGHDLNHLTSSDGTLKTASPLNFSEMNYTAPSALPAKNPVTITVRFHPDPLGKEIVILQCAVTIVDAYKVSGDVILTSDLTGMDMKLHIEDFVRYTVLNNGAAILEPLNGKGTLRVKVEKDIMLNKNGGLGKYISPMEFDMPVLISIDKQGSKTGAATFYFKSFSSPDNDETYLMTSGAASQQVKQNYVNHTVFNVFFKDIQKAMTENISNGQATIEWANRMKAIQNKPRDQLTEQDKKDIAQLRALQQKTGKENPFGNVPIGDGMKVGGNYSTADLNRQAPAMAVGNGAGELNVPCTFNPVAKTVLEVNKEGSDPGNVNHVIIHIKIEK
ncbi:MAG: hypothetical protein ACRDE5_02010, partial [Ginsengibacter sp.]